MSSNFRDYKAGVLAGLPIMLGYISVSFGIGILAHQAGLSALQAAFMSGANLTSAGEAAGIDIIASGGTLLEMAITQLVINFRYLLMSISLSQRTDESFTTSKRIIASFGITDEIFALLVSRNKSVTAAYMMGVITLPFIGWTGGTAIGAIAGSILPKTVSDSLGILLYGMFVAIIVPPAKEDKHIIFAVFVAAGISSLLKYLVPHLTSGFAVIIAALCAAVVAAVLFPVSERDIEEEGGRA